MDRIFDILIFIGDNIFFYLEKNLILWGVKGFFFIILKYDFEFRDKENIFCYGLYMYDMVNVILMLIF